MEAKAALLKATTKKVGGMSRLTSMLKRNVAMFKNSKQRESAAKKIQKLYRGRLGRKRWTRTLHNTKRRNRLISRMAAVKLQRKWRDRVARKEKLQNAAILLQSFFRGRHLRLHVISIRKMRNAAIVLQRSIRSRRDVFRMLRKTRKRKRYVELVMRMQARVRGWQMFRIIQKQIVEVRSRTEGERGLKESRVYVRDRLLLLSIFGDIEEDGPMQRVFLQWCGAIPSAALSKTRRGKRGKKSTKKKAEDSKSQGSKKQSQRHRLDNMHFTKLIRSTSKLINKKSRDSKSGKLVSVEVVKTTDIDLVFQKHKEKGRRTVTFNKFGILIQSVADLRFSSLESFRNFRGEHARLLKAIWCILHSKWAKSVRDAFELKALEHYTQIYTYTNQSDT